MSIASLAAVLKITAGLILIALLPLVVRVYGNMRTAVIMHQEGAAFGGPLLPWHTVARIVVTNPGNGRNVELGARLRPDARLPDDA